MGLKIEFLTCKMQPFHHRCGGCLGYLKVRKIPPGGLLYTVLPTAV